jgi:hypothetical protein
MSKTPFSSKCFILGTLWLNYREDAADNDSWSQFFSYNDIALPMSYMISEDLVHINNDSDADTLIEETWKLFCEYINIDPEGEYKDIAEAFAASEQPPLELEDESK